MEAEVLVCNLTVNPKSLNCHLKKMHNTEFTPSCICVDESEGIYFIRKSMKGGIVYRTNVQRKVSAASATILCEEERSADYMNLAKRPGIPTVECIHLQLCNKCPQYTQEADLSLGSLKHLSGKVKSNFFPIKPFGYANNFTKVRKVMELGL